MHRGGNNLRRAGAIVACLIGAGFASGQEVVQFFSLYGGLRGALGALLACLVLAAACAWMLGDASGGPVFVRWCGRPAGTLLQGAAPVFLFGVYAVMLSGAGAMLETASGLPAWVGRTFLLAATLATVWGGLTRMTELLGRLGPLIALFAVATGAAALVWGPRTPQARPVLLPPARSWWMAALLYAGYNFYLLVPFLQGMGQTVKRRGEAARTALAACGIFGAALLLLHGGLTLCPGTMTSPAPAVALAAELWPQAAWAALPVLLAGVYTTAAPLLFGVSGSLGGSRKAMLGAALAGWACSALPFDRLVGGFFPVIGWFGLAMIACRAVTGAGHLLRCFLSREEPSAQGNGGAPRRTRQDTGWKCL